MEDLRYSENGKELLECLNKYKTHFDIRNGTEVIHDSAFENCDNLRTITFPDSVKEIRQSAFSRCRRLSSVVIPENTDTIGHSAFLGCISLESVIVESCKLTIGQDAFKKCTGLVFVSFRSCAGETGQDAFKECKGSPVGSCSVTIGEYAFSGCTRLTPVSFNPYVSEIGRGAFQNCTDLDMVITPSNMGTINRGVFYGSGLTHLIIGSKVTSIKSKAFAECKGLMEIGIRSSTPPTCDLDAFENVPTDTCILLVPPGTKGNYQRASVWENFSRIYEF